MINQQQFQSLVSCHVWTIWLARGFDSITIHTSFALNLSLTIYRQSQQKLHHAAREWFLLMVCEINGEVKFAFKNVNFALRTNGTRQPKPVRTSENYQKVPREKKKFAKQVSTFISCGNSRIASWWWNCLVFCRGWFREQIKVDQLRCHSHHSTVSRNV